MATRVEFGTFDSIWNTHPKGKYPKYPCFCHTGMVWDRFEILCRCVVLSDKKKKHPHEMTHEALWWKLVGVFVERINRTVELISSYYDISFVHESISH